MDHHTTGDAETPLLVSGPATPLISDFLRDVLAEQAGRANKEHRDQDTECNRVLERVVLGSRDECLGHTHYKPAHHGAGYIAGPAENRGYEGFQARLKTEQRRDLNVRQNGDHGAARARKSGPETK